MKDSDYFKWHKKNWWKFKICLHKSYLDQGIGLTNFLKYIVLLAGGGSIIATDGASTSLAVLGVIGYMIVCYISGRYYFTHGFKEAEMEVGNQFNLFVKEVRERKSI